MQMKLDVDFLLFGYMFVCILLLIFNALYIIYAQNLKMALIKNTKKWKSQIGKQLLRIKRKGVIDEKHTKLLVKKLRNTNELMAYARAMNKMRKEKTDVQEYLNQCYRSYQQAAYHYLGKDSMDKAFFANFIAENAPDLGGEYRSIMKTLQAFLVDSTVYCRENVLRAMYALGSVQAVLNVIEYIEENNIFHHQKLIADGLMSLNGDKKAMAEVLWENRLKWSESTLLAVIQFITASVSGFEELFFEELQKEEVSIEVKLALLRYYQRHIYEPVCPLLYEYARMESCSEVNLAIVAASVLKNYPGEETIKVLTDALRDANWYVRYNAATSLVQITQDEKIMQQILGGDDQYAKEILTYKLEELEMGGKQ